jgi:aspartate racemase
MNVEFRDSDLDPLTHVQAAPAFEPLHRRIERRLMLHPQGCALQDGDSIWSSSELNAGANRLAWYLQGLGAGPGHLVAICLPRGIEAIVSMLAVLKCGAAFVPLDPAYPVTHRAHKLADSGPLLLITLQTLSGMMPPHAAREIHLDAQTVLQRLQIEHAHDLPVVVDRESAAYVIYTSGSTGKPKGVVIPHGALRNHADAVIERYALVPQDRVLQFASLSFDICIEEIFPTLAIGATLVLHDVATSSRVDDFLASIEDRRVTLLNLPTAFWHELVLAQPLWRKPFPECVRLLVVGGERASRALHRRWVDNVGPRPRWMNAYGPTEATVTATVYEPAAHPGNDKEAELPIGLPLSNTRCHVLDENLKPVPPGEEGELCIGGESLALGYLNLPELTAQRFVPDPFSGRAGARLYRSGDRARILPDGCIAFLGRVDAQFKVRGFRIEAAEIEACLEGDPAIEQAIVVGEANPLGTVLKACLRLRPGLTLDEPALRSRLKRELPDYMHPSGFWLAQEWPLLPSGKVDREALAAQASRTATAPGAPAPASVPDPAPVRPFVLQCGVTADEDDLASWLAPVFADVLSLPAVDPELSFFEMGGNSLLALRLLSVLEAQRPQQVVRAEVFFSHPSVRELARALAVEASLGLIGTAALLGLASVVRLNRCDAQAEKRTPLLLLCGVALYAPLAQAMASDRPVYGLFVPAELVTGTGASMPDLPKLAAQYVGRIQGLVPDGPFSVGGVSFGGTMAFEVARQLAQQGRPPRLLVMLDAVTTDSFGPAATWVRVKSCWDRWRRRRDPDSSVRRADALDVVEEVYRRQKTSYAGQSLLVVATGRTAEPHALQRSDLGWYGRFCREDLGWARYLPVGTPCVRVSGDHLGILRGVGAQAIAASVRAHLAEQN